MLRELTREEWELVSGGDITVTGGRGVGTISVRATMRAMATDRSIGA
jgi:hypothetical protein